MSQKRGAKVFREKRSRNMKPHHHQYPFKWEALGLEIILRVQNACIEDPAMKYLTSELECLF